MTSDQRQEVLWECCIAGAIGGVLCYPLAIIGVIGGVVLVCVLASLTRW